ncbi:hypothetical protein [Aestuariivirga sp.]|uniref:hypothetical protein n=1 Tax=Aestuariivirga sp. TaxID=2650926 RepID=UPI0039E48995
MGRSVSKPIGCIATAYRTFESEGDEWEDRENFRDLKEWIAETCKSKWPSLRDCDEWIGREDHAILENDHAYVGLSEYCGMACIWLTAKGMHNGNDRTTALQFNWCRTIAPKFEETFGEYRKVTTMSNGAAIYEAKTPDGRASSVDRMGGLFADKGLIEA